MRRTLVIVVVLGLLAVFVAPVGAAPPVGAPFPDAIPLPDGFFPEGIAIDDRTAYVGSLVDGAIVQQDLKTGETEQLAPSPGPNKIAVGLDVDHLGRLWVAGGGPALNPTIIPGFRVYDTATGAMLLEMEVAAGFVNDVIVTRDAAWLTDSFAPRLIRVPITSDGGIGDPEPVALAGDWVQAPGFNANGIVATPDEKTLVVAQSTSPDRPGAALYNVPADLTSGSVVAGRIDIDDALPGADGLVLVGRTLYSVAGPAGVVKMKISLADNTARIVDTLAVPGAVTPTTAAQRGSSLYVVDAKFPFFGDPTVEFQTTAIAR